MGDKDNNRKRDKDQDEERGTVVGDASGEEPTGQAPSNQWVKYLAGGDGLKRARVISKQDFVRAGADKDKAETVVWNNGNGFLVNRDELNFLDDDQFASIILADSGFAVVDGEEVTPTEVTDTP